MSVPRDLIIQRLNRNLDTLLQTGARVARGLFWSEIHSPFRSAGQSGEASPFMKSLFPEIRLAAILERSLNTALGWGWDKIAGDIALATHGNAEIGHFVEGKVPATTASHIDAICLSYTSGEGHGTPNTTTELAAILPGITSPGAKEDIREKDDVFYISSGNVENHIEIKTPKPNYDQMRAAKRRILRIHAVRAPRTVRAFVGMPYNPNGYYGDYAWPTTKYFVDEGQDLLVGEKFWNYVGNSDQTYNELMECFLVVSEQRRHELVILLEGGM